MKQSMSSLFKQWVLYQKLSVHSTNQCIDACFKYCQEQSNPLCNYRLEKNISDICLKLQEIHHYQKSINSFEETDAIKLHDDFIVAECDQLQLALYELNCRVTVLLAELKTKMNTLKTRLHYSDIFRTQLESSTLL